MEFNENFTGLISSGTYQHIEVFTTEKVERGKNRICLNKTVLKNRIQMLMVKKHISKGPVFTFIHFRFQKSLLRQRNNFGIQR